MCDECRPDIGNERGYITLDEIDRLISVGIPVYLKSGLPVQRVFALPATTAGAST